MTGNNNSESSEENEQLFVLANFLQLFSHSQLTQRYLIQLLNTIKQDHRQRDVARGSRAVHSDNGDQAAVEKWGPK